MSKTFYITTTLPYVNADPHVGFAMETIRADAIARVKKLQGLEVFFNTGTDEHGQKVLKKADELSRDPKQYVDELSEKYKHLKNILNLSEDLRFIRTTDPHHASAAQEFWKRCQKNGDIYKKDYEIKYCVGCELEKTDSEIENGRCILHPNLEIEIRHEENYFFRFSNYKDKLLALYEKNPKLVIPDFRFNEIKSFVERGLEDFSISRLKSKMSWGVPVPEDPEHVMYVWFDALINYVSTLGWPEDSNNFEKFWIKGRPVQYAGKDNVRQQAAMWQAMLISAGLPNTNTIVINGFITSGGQKMSKSLGNVINPFEIVKEYGTDALRYYCLRELAPFEDSDMTLEKFRESYNANLANGLGNLVSRIMKMAQDNLASPVTIAEREDMSEYFALYENFDLKRVSDFVWNEISEMDKFIQVNEPFKVVKEDKEKGQQMISQLVVRLYSVARKLNPLLTETSEKIKALIKANVCPDMPLFARKD